MQHIEGFDLLCFKEKIYIPQSFRQSVQTCTEETIRNTMPWPYLTQDAESSRPTCLVCQFTKKQRKRYGLFPPKEAESDPHVIDCVDLVGLFTIMTPLKAQSLLVFTMIDAATGWFEIFQAPGF
jgi:hypothetical protein